MKIAVLGVLPYEKRNGVISFPGGTERFTFSLLTCLDTFSNIEYDFYLYRTKYYKDEYLEDYKSRFKNLIEFKVLNSRREEKEFDEIANKKYDLVISDMFFYSKSRGLSYLSRIEKLSKKVKLILFSHGLNVCIYPEVEKISEDMTNHFSIIASNHFELYRLETLNYKNLIYMDYPVELKRLYLPRKKTIVCNARICSGKGQANVMKLMKYLPEYYFIFLGSVENDSSWRGFQYSLKVNNINPDQFEVNKVDREELAQIVSSAAYSIFLPNSDEGGNLGIKESLMVGTPLILRGKLKKDYDLNEEVSIFIDRYNNDSFQKAADKIRNSNWNYDKICEYANNRYSLETFSKKLYKLIKD